MTPSQQTNADITALIRSRHTFLWVVTREELRVERAIIEAAAAAKFETKIWDCSAGLLSGEEAVASLADPGAMLNRIRDDETRCVYIMRDLHKWSDPVTQRALRTLARKLQNATAQKARTIIVLTPSSEIPIELAGHATVIEYPLPARPEISDILDGVLSALEPDFAAKALPEGTRDAAIDAAVGLTAEEAANCYAKSLVTTKRIDPGQVSFEKKRVIAREKVLTWYDPDPRGLAAVGGLELLKAWLGQRREAFSQRARDYGLPAPKGCLLAGVPGCGKSLTAKAVAAAWGMPLLRLDFGALKGKFVGESEGNIRKALAVAETVAPCVLWLDELEKAMAGATGAQGDGGVSADALGAVLSWMQERQGNVFVIATANNVEGLPPELLRKGRFDELFFVDLPTPDERAQVLAATMKQLCKKEGIVDAAPVVAATQGFTGAEIAAIVADAMIPAFTDGERAVTTEDLVLAAKNVTPLSETMEEQITKLRKWAKGRCRSASVTVAESSRVGRDLDL